ncbi:hypothetical protein MtrunA17_Chr4g0030481 [Medicago truncatula]|uniref:Uncharacterized protein n=1 Tax=Medicago truncatula TaxID=3880 RepID=A0A396IDG5_MEDTR|nr:hypothetical protein MtrunA17_Chr4g0030481 [Medicago truncatula]
MDTNCDSNSLVHVWLSSGKGETHVCLPQKRFDVVWLSFTLPPSPQVCIIIIDFQ